MSTARHVATIDLLCARSFPAERAGSEVGTSGPGYHLVELARGESFWEDDGSRRVQEAEQYEAECAALASVLAARWGEPQLVSLWSTRVRGGEGEEIPEPWRELSHGVGHVHLWRTGGRWVAVGVSHQGEEHPFQLLAAVTETDPP
ncbi:hypothetical protein OIE71_03360 [Streptomyces sp. NBC_01725]|uniref:hypothetical protein n=1 Tax=Streptomyces sp. NBC_01725 TaxID=2975923 RepID=UPI002E2CC6C7|nr:hypothetical protein [Streptomyces sp. NBC_01725]